MSWMGVTWAGAGGWRWSARVGTLDDVGVTGPVLLAVGDEGAAEALVGAELSKRYGADYRVVCERSARAALQALGAGRENGEQVALVLADLEMPEMTGLEFLAGPTSCIRGPAGC
jgi:hypothetical protein